jgi:hypothetical protein
MNNTSDTFNQIKSTSASMTKTKSFFKRDIYNWNSKKELEQASSFFENKDKENITYSNSNIKVPRKFFINKSTLTSTIDQTINAKSNEVSAKNLNLNNIYKNQNSVEETYLPLNRFLNKKIDPFEKKMKEYKLKNRSEKPKSLFTFNYKIPRESNTDLILPMMKKNKDNHNSISNSNSNITALYTFSSITKFKKVEPLLKTEMRLRENINKKIKKKSDSIVKEDNIDKILFKTKSSTKEMIKELYDKTKLSKPILEEYTKSKDTKNIHQTMIVKPPFFEINAAISFPAMVNDLNLIHDVYNSNLIELKRRINKKISQNPEKYKKYL